MLVTRNLTAGREASHDFPLPTSVGEALQVLRNEFGSPLVDGLANPHLVPHSSGRSAVLVAELLMLPDAGAQVFSFTRMGPLPSPLPKA